MANNFIDPVSGETFKIDTEGLSDGYKFNNFVGIKRGKKEQLEKYIEYFYKYGEEPSIEWMKQNTSLDHDKAYENISSDFGRFLRQNGVEDRDIYRQQVIENSPEIQKNRQENPEIAAEGERVDDPYLWDPSRVREEGTKENDLYQLYLDQGKAQGDITKQNLQSAERDMQISMAQQRKQLLDEVRKRRQNQLRSGLSSAQIANEEIQMMLMGQQQQQQTAQGYYDQYVKAMQNQQMNPYNAEIAARQGSVETAQGLAPTLAASAGDQVSTGIRYGNLSDPYKKYVDSRVKNE